MDVQSYLKIFKEATKSQHGRGKSQVCPGSKLSQNFQRSNQITTSGAIKSRSLVFKVISKFSKKQPNHNYFLFPRHDEVVQSYLKIFKEATKSQPSACSPYSLHCSKLSQNFQRSNQITTNKLQELLKEEFKVISKFSKKQPNHNSAHHHPYFLRVQSYLKIFKEATKSQQQERPWKKRMRSKLSQNFQRSNQITTRVRFFWPTICSKLSQNFQRSNQITTTIIGHILLIEFKVISKFSKKQPNHNRQSLF